MLNDYDAIKVAGLMLVDRENWYDRQKEVLSDRRYRAHVLAGNGNMLYDYVVFELGGVRYATFIDYDNGKVQVGRVCRNTRYEFEARRIGEGFVFEKIEFF